MKWMTIQIKDPDGLRIVIDQTDAVTIYSSDLQGKSKETVSKFLYEATREVAARAHRGVFEAVIAATGVKMSLAEIEAVIAATGVKMSLAEIEAFAIESWRDQAKYFERIAAQNAVKLELVEKTMTGFKAMLEVFDGDTD